jgi:CubicO group peptidase (beta-lactamase class C family)
LLSEARAKFNVPAIAVVTMNSSSIMYSEIQGTRVAGTENPVTSSDYFHIGSCSKSVSAVIAGKLVDEGKINWSTKFFDVFPELKADSNPAYADITLEDLFLCQAGIEPYTSGDQKFPEISPTAKNQKLEFAKYLLKQPPVSAKGNDGKFSFLYSNAGYTVAIVMLEKVSNKTYEKLLNETMKSNNLSFHIGWPNSISENQPWGHMIIDGKLQSFAPDHEYKLNDLITPAGGLSMNPLDYAKYTQLHLQGLRGQNNYLSSNTYNYIDFGHPGFSFGVANSKLGGYKYAGFDGSAGTFFCRSIIVPDSDFAFTVMMNEGSGTGTMKAVDWITMEIVKKHYNWWWKFWL